MAEKQTGNSMIALITGLGRLLVGIAAVIVALSFTNKRFDSDVSKLPQPDPGFEIVFAGENAFLVNKATGNVWAYDAYRKQWCSQPVQTIQKPSSYRNDDTLGCSR